MIKESFIVIKLFYLSMILLQNKLESLFLEKNILMDEHSSFFAVAVMTMKEIFKT